MEAPRTPRTTMTTLSDVAELLRHRWQGRELRLELTHHGVGFAAIRRTILEDVGLDAGGESAGLAFGDGDGKTIFTLAVDDVTLERADVYEELTEVRLDELGVVLMEPPEPGAGWDGDWPVIC